MSVESRPDCSEQLPREKSKIIANTGAFIFTAGWTEGQIERTMNWLLKKGYDGFCLVPLRGLKGEGLAKLRGKHGERIDCYGVAWNPTEKELPLSLYEGVCGLYKRVVKHDQTQPPVPWDAFPPKKADSDAQLREFAKKFPQARLIHHQFDEVWSDPAFREAQKVLKVESLNRQEEAEEAGVVAIDPFRSCPPKRIFSAQNGPAHSSRDLWGPYFEVYGKKIAYVDIQFPYTAKVEDCFYSFGLSELAQEMKSQGISARVSTQVLPRPVSFMAGLLVDYHGLDNAQWLGKHAQDAAKYGELLRKGARFCSRDMDTLAAFPEALRDLK